MGRRVWICGCLLLWVTACIQGKDRPGDAKVIKFPDLTVDSARHDGVGDGVEPDQGVDTRSPDGSVDTRSPDTTVDALSPDTTVDTLSPDSTVDTLSPDTTVDTLSLDTTVDANSSSQDGAAASCVGTVDNDTVMLLTFEGSGSTITDVTGNHDGTLVGSNAARVAGRAGCGNALDFDPTNNFSYVEVPDSSEWVIDNGSIDLWVNPRNTPLRSAGIISRNDRQLGDGEFTLFQVCNGSFIARFQEGLTGRSVCSDPVSKGNWHYVGVNFGTGGLELFVDGRRAQRTSLIVCLATVFECGESTEQGLTSRPNPWVIGARSSDSDPGSATPVDGPFDGMLDSVRVSSVRRGF